jgi:hypothetical protein
MTAKRREELTAAWREQLLVATFLYLYRIGDPEIKPIIELLRRLMRERAK